MRERYVLSVLPTDRVQMDHLEAASHKYAESLAPDGNWPDVAYQSKGQTHWDAVEHLNRTLVMAKEARLLRNRGHADAALDAKVIRALHAWTAADWQNPNWWWNEIGVPELCGEIAALMQPVLAPEEIAKVAGMMQRWKQEHDEGPWEGANLTWLMAIEIVRGCLLNDSAAVAAGYETLYKEIRLAGPDDEGGIQPDFSFHQHGRQLMNGGYGMLFAADVGRFIAYAWGTRFQISAEGMALFSAYLLDGEQWMMQGDLIDYSTVGRIIARPGTMNESRDWTEGPIAPPGPAYTLPNVVALLAAMPTSRQRELQEFAARMQGKSDAPALTGNKYFRISDYMVHRGRKYMTSVKMLSGRMQNAEIIDNEGKKSHHLSDGASFLYQTGKEYLEIFPAWDWTKIPGTTAIEGTLETGDENPIGMLGKSAFAGGVSDGTYGMAAMDLVRGGLTAKKAWFFFGDSYLCLGAGITLEGDAEHGVATDVNQTLLMGPVMTSETSDPAEDGMHSFTSKGAGWVYHDHAGYVLAPGTQFTVSVGERRGAWSAIGPGTSDVVTRRIFNFWIDHGRPPANGTYAYVVLPGASQEETKLRAAKPEIRVLANWREMQAAWDDKLGVGMIAFRRTGSLETPAGRVEVDHACLLLMRADADGWRISAASPEQLSIPLHVRLREREVAIELPGGDRAGASVSVEIRDSTKPQ